MHRRVALPFVLSLLAIGCGGGDDDGASNDGGTADAAADAPIDAFVPANCNSLVKPTGPANFIDHIPASEDFGFDKDGFLIGVSMNDNALVRTAYPAGSGPEILAENISNDNFARAARQLPNGDIIVAVPSTSSVERFSPGVPTWQSTPIASISDPNGAVIGADGKIYLTAGSGSVTRIDPDTMEMVPLHTAATTFDGITMSPDGTTLYFNQEMGMVESLTIDASGPVGAPQPVTTIPIDFLLDGMTTDACGNIYIVEMAGRIWRYSTDGVLDEWVTRTQLVPGPSLIPAVNFGSGRGGWLDTALYIMNFDGGVYEIDIGVVGRPTANL